MKSEKPKNENENSGNQKERKSEIRKKTKIRKRENQKSKRKRKSIERERERARKENRKPTVGRRFLPLENLPSSSANGGRRRERATARDCKPSERKKESRGERKKRIGERDGY